MMLVPPNSSKCISRCSIIQVQINTYVELLCDIWARPVEFFIAAEFIRTRREENLREERRDSNL